MQINDLRQLRAFVMVVQTGSFSGAARALGMSQSAVSQAIRQLEDELKVRLLDRTTRSLQLSKVGVEFLPGIQRVLGDLDHQLEDLQDLREHRRGHVTMACVPSVALRLMPKILAAFKIEHPLVNVTIKETSRHQLIHSLRNGDIELGIANVPGDDPELEARLLLTDSFALVMRRDDVLAARKTVTWEDGSAAGLIVMAAGTGIRLEMDRAISAPVKGAPLYEAEHPATLLAMVEAGVGVAPLPGLAWPDANHPVLTFRKLTGPVIERKLYVIWRSGRELSPAARALHRAILSKAPKRI
ncbi:LysR family transcriptional regulator [Bradyrhizobium lablabi]|uniref:LysR family transcriptional regulator n=1 Tax=Bradyrhizobium lablabi TaxID=722472 RepID=UPI001BAC347C|nr:LysR family transcriptional regulator [Bradyrhizobium lablabi]MBR1119893.1 LysR family transcriptional regulator [Bradyrhizobium lablabi]